MLPLLVSPPSETSLLCCQGDLACPEMSDQQSSLREDVVMNDFDGLTELGCRK